MKTDNIIKIASLADQIKELATEVNNTKARPFKAKLHSELLTSELIDHFNIRRRENGELINKNENHFLIYLNKRIFKYRSSEENHFEYNHFYVHCQVALNGFLTGRYLRTLTMFMNFTAEYYPVESIMFLKMTKQGLSAA